MKEYRVLVELDESGSPMESIAIIDATDTVVKWIGSADEAFEWVKENGKLAVEYEMPTDDDDVSEYDDRMVAKRFLSYLIKNSKYIHELYSNTFYEYGAWLGIIRAINYSITTNLNESEQELFRCSKYYNEVVEAWISDRDITF